MSETLDQEGRDEMVAAGWDVTDTKATKIFIFKNFIEAFGWMTSAAIVAETLNHHPEWFMSTKPLMSSSRPMTQAG